MKPGGKRFGPPHPRKCGLMAVATAAKGDSALKLELKRLTQKRQNLSGQRLRLLFDGGVTGGGGGRGGESESGQRTKGV